MLLFSLKCLQKSSKPNFYHIISPFIEDFWNFFFRNFHIFIVLELFNRLQSIALKYIFLCNFLITSSWSYRHYIGIPLETWSSIVSVIIFMKCITLFHLNVKIDSEECWRYNCSCNSLNWHSVFTNYSRRLRNYSLALFLFFFFIWIWLMYKDIVVTQVVTKWWMRCKLIFSWYSEYFTSINWILVKRLPS